MPVDGDGGVRHRLTPFSIHGTLCRQIAPHFLWKRLRSVALYSYKYLRFPKMILVHPFLLIFHFRIFLTFSFYNHPFHLTQRLIGQFRKNIIILHLDKPKSCSSLNATDWWTPLFPVPTLLFCQDHSESLSVRYRYPGRRRTCWQSCVIPLYQ